MNPQFLIPLTVLLISITSCYSEFEKPENKMSPHTSRSVNDAEEAVLHFYEWYLRDIYLKKSVEGPEMKLTKDSIFQLDPSEHIKFLDSSGFFSPNFYQNEIPMYKACDEELKKVNPEELDGPLNITECGFLNYMNWTGGQGETLNTVDILKSNIESNTAKVVAVIGDSTGLNYSYPSVTLLKENNKWKISRIDISFNAPKK